MPDSHSPEPAWERFRLRGQAAEIASEGWAPDSMPFLPSQPGTNKASERAAPTSGLLSWLRRVGKVELAIASASILGVLASLILFVDGTGIQTVGLVALVALVPLVLVTWLLVRADRYAPPLARILLLAALWGAGIAATIAGLINSGLLSDLIATTGDTEFANSVVAIGVAPLGEELFKGLGVALVLVIGANQVVSRSNGLVVGGVVGASFAFVENIQYFIEAYAQGTAVLGLTIVGRAVLSPFIHPMATSFTGFAFAAALLRRGGWWSWTWRLSLGFLLAVSTHALWNALASVGTQWILLYVLIEVPLFIIWLIWVSRQAPRNLKMIRTGLESYQATGWLAPAEVQMVCEPVARRYARRWARKVGPQARKALRRYLRAGGRLGLDQVNMERTGLNVSRANLAKQSLTLMSENRDSLLSLGELYAARQAKPAGRR